jgi:hypothetical protein
MISPMLQAAVGYASQEISVFPCAKKIPLIPGGFKNATWHPEQIVGWWSKWPDAQIGIPTGKINHLFVIDVDGPEGERAATKLNLPETFTVATRPGRWQFWFRQPDGMCGKCSAGALGSQLDTRGDGGYVIAPPSIHHETGKPYRVVKNLPWAPAPIELLEPRAVPGSHAPTADTIPQGQRHKTMLSIAGALRARGLSRNVVLGELRSANERLCIPPLDASEIQKIADYVGTKAAGLAGQRPQETSTEVELESFRDVRAEPVRADLPTKLDIRIQDMPESVLDGKLGKICQGRMKDFPFSLAWPSLLAAAAALVRPENGHLRTNLFVALVGPAGCGKTQAICRANSLLDVKPPLLEQMKAGSIEGLLAQLGDRPGQSVLFFPDELSHLLEKAQIPNACFAYVFNTLFYRDEETLTIAHGKKVHFNCRLSLIGGMVDEKFEDGFGSASTGGLYDRFLFGQCPTGFEYLYRPFEGPPALTECLDECKVNRDVWDARDAILAKEKLSRRVVEIALRVAAICASADGRELRARDLGPAWELARYQTRIRCLLQPNRGKNFEGMLAHKILAYLARFDGKFVPRRQMLKAIRAYDLGPSIAERALAVLIANGDVATTTVGKMALVRLVTADEESREILDSIGGTNA